MIFRPRELMEFNFLTQISASEKEIKVIITVRTLSQPHLTCHSVKWIIYVLSPLFGEWCWGRGAVLLPAICEYLRHNGQLFWKIQYLLTCLYLINNTGTFTQLDGLLNALVGQLKQHDAHACNEKFVDSIPWNTGTDNVLKFKSLWIK